MAKVVRFPQDDSVRRLVTLYNVVASAEPVPPISFAIPVIPNRSLVPRATYAQIMAVVEKCEAKRIDRFLNNGY